MKKILSILAIATSIIGLCTCCGTPSVSNDPALDTPTRQATPTTEPTATSTPTPTPAPTSLKVLAIGNSFSVDAMAHLWGICADGGIDNITLGNLDIGGCTLERHWKNLFNEANDYSYHKNTDGNWVRTEGKSIQYALADEQWDVITIQQASGMSGIPFAIEEYISDIVAYLKEKQPNAKIYWHMTWAYQNDSTHSAFDMYDNDQITMYNSIVDTVKSQIIEPSFCDGIIPSGTAIQNLRTSYIGDTITADGYHLNWDRGRYTAALTWYCYITGNSPDNIQWVPSSYPLLIEDLPAIKEAVSAALNEPFAITESTLK